MIKHTLQEIADFFGCWVAVDASGLMVYGYHSKPKLGSTTFYGDFIGGVGYIEIISDLPEDWSDSLTPPSEPPFKEGEIVVGKRTGLFTLWKDETMYAESQYYRRPTEAEWKTLRGE